MKIPIIPERQIFCNKAVDSRLNLKAICIFAATGFFLEKDTYFENIETLQPAWEYEFDENNFIKKSKQYWHWHYSPREINLKQATEEFADLFEKISYEYLNGKKIILPLSGGLDSRTQAAAMTNDFEVNCYSYKFEGSFEETKYGKEISELKSFPFNEYIIRNGYLWKVIDELAEINQCYADFTHPRQMAVINDISKLGEVFYLGHWGDVLFDNMGVEDNIPFKEQVEILLNKIIKRGGLELAESLWKSWQMEGDFKDYIRERISSLVEKIKIDSANSRIRAFKSMYWAPRWTSANMAVFSYYRPVVLPYYDDEMCKFICTIPEKLLEGRQIQINYIKMKNPKLAKISWQNFDPLNLYNYKKFKSKGMIPFRALKKGKRIIKEKLFGKKLTTRNWEIQFIGDKNDQNLKKYLFENDSSRDFISTNIVKDFYDKFKYKNSVYYSHPVSMLLTLSMFSRKYLLKNE